ncbi:MAG TPA: hypothetical protein VMW35_02920 [Myxococcota bacterium]|jgi:hypothetical protein|nr:hypothetical protein [Myxococcota bacterium]
MCAVFGGYASQLLELAGARDVAVAKDACRVDGAAACAWRVKWQDAG